MALKTGTCSLEGDDATIDEARRLVTAYLQTYAPQVNNEVIDVPVGGDWRLVRCGTIFSG